MDNRGALVSIIVPVYNAEAWLSRCIESILAQTYKNFELICVDDGSTDSSGAICDEYARNDTRIRVVHRPNSGVSAARNAGLDLAAGEYIMFVDSDDWIEPEHVQLLLPNGSEDWVYGGYKAFLGATITDERGYPEQMIYRKDWMENFEMFWSTMLLFSASCSCYSSGMIKKNRLRFDADVHMGEDELFNLKYIQQCSSIRFTGKSTYHYRQSQSGSLMNSYHPNRLQDCMRIGQLVETVGETKMYHYRWIRWHMALAHYKK